MSSTSFRVNLYSLVCLNVKKLLAQSRRYIWSLSDQLVRKRTLNHLAKLVSQTECSFTNLVVVGSNPVAIIPCMAFEEKYFQLFLILLTLSRRRYLSYRNQSIDLQSKSIGWFLYDRDLRHEKLTNKFRCLIAFTSWDIG